MLIPPERKHDIRFVANFSFYLLLKATRKQEAIWRSRLCHRPGVHPLTSNLGFESRKSKPPPAARLPSVWNFLQVSGGERDGGAWPGGQLEEEAEVDQEGEGGDQQWHHHQDLAETLRRWWPMLIFD